MTAMTSMNQIHGMQRDAQLSECGTYRYLLTRTWDDRLPTVCFIMLNPSTADAEKDDNTIRKCLGFAYRWKFGRLYVVNLYALRSTDPSLVPIHPDPIGPFNDYRIGAVASISHKVICAWGTEKFARIRAKTVMGKLRADGIELWALRRSKGGHPYHPLYQPYDRELVRMT